MPAWLGERMTRLGAVISEAIVHHYGRDELLRRLAHPFWFQSFGAVMGMDWHSSGITTSVIGALKRGLEPLRGRARHPCLRRPRQAFAPDARTSSMAIGERVGFDGAALAQASRLVAKVDSAAVQDGFELYLHGFIVADDGRWVVVQQGMNGDAQAGAPLSLAVGRADELRRGAACGDRGPAPGRRSSTSPTAARRPRGAGSSSSCARSGRTGSRARRRRSPRRPAAPAPAQPLLPHLVMPAHHDVRAERRRRAAPARRPRRGGRARPGRFRRAPARRPASARAPCARSPWWPRSCTARPTASPIRPASRSPMAARTATPSRCRFGSTTRPSGC